jgi:hypothetical protein
MTWPANEPTSARQDAASRLNGDGTATNGTGARPGGRPRLPIRLVVGALAAVVLVGTAVHIGPAIRAGLHDGTRGTWVAASVQCSKSGGCVWQGKFVLSDGRVQIANSGYAGQLPFGLHVGTSLPAIYPGGSNLVFPATGSDLWISLLIGLVVGALGLYWASHRWVANFIRKRRGVAVPGQPPRS